ncbi:rhomboid family intramembrane serine protease [Aquipuribacter sp. MA13-6]|uniref:rhomboid family intramembrane serine protease n=1 Tax=unclassified Aquipuribacter TaxID=2635084 RepID=UPI003EE9A958
MAYVRCQRCERPACPDCQRPAAVGVHCVDCVRAQPAVTARTVAGAPLGDGRPVVTQTLIGVLVVVWLAQAVLPGVTRALAFAPVLSMAEPWRFLTLGLVHSPGLPLHLLLNGFALWVIGREIEVQLGRWRYLTLLVLSTIASAVGVLWLTPTTSDGWFGLTVGASGAVFGLLGAAVALNGRRGEPVVRQVLVLLVLAAAGLLLPSISWQGHVGGLIGGLLVGGVLVLAPRTNRTRWQVGGLVAVIVLLVVLTVVRWLVVGPGVLA